MNFKHSKKEKLKSKKLIEQLFVEGKAVSNYPLRLIFMELPDEAEGCNKIAVSVSKKKFKLAVDRNRIKRLLREGVRLHKNDYFNNITTHYALMILYIGSDKPTFLQVETSMHLLFEKFRKKVSNR